MKQTHQPPSPDRPNDDELKPTDRHFIIGNETRHDLFYDFIADRGGTYVGVGSEQNYSLLAVADAEWAYLIDIDTGVLEFHQLLAILIRESDTPEKLIECFAASAADDSAQRIATATAHLGSRSTKLTTRYHSVRARVEVHLRNVARSAKPTWLSSMLLYQRVRALSLANRLEIRAGDLQGTRTLKDVALQIRDTTPVRTIYLSNAEEYLDNQRAFAANLEALSAPSQTLVLRTIYREDWDPADGLWSYQVQSLDDLLERMERTPTANIRQMLQATARDGTLDEHLPGYALSSIGLPR